MSTIKIKQVNSRIGAPADQKRTLDALGLRKLNRVVAVSYTHLDVYKRQVLKVSKFRFQDV